jgi:hypothetical protein
LDPAAHTSLSPIRRGFAPGFVDYKNGCNRFATASDKVYQLLAHGRWFSPGTPASSTTKTGRHDKAEILLKVALKHQKSNQKSNLLSSHNHVLKNKSKFSLMRCYYLDLTKYRFNNCQETSRKKEGPGGSMS